MSLSVRLMVPGLPVVDHMMVTCRGHLFFSILVAKIVYEPATWMVTVVSLVVSRWLISMVTQHVVMYTSNCMAAGWCTRP